VIKFANELDKWSTLCHGANQFSYTIENDVWALLTCFKKEKKNPYMIVTTTTINGSNIKKY
jgi:hypothetical protein